MSLDSASVEAKPTTEEPSKETPEQPLGLSQDEAEYPPAKTVALIVLALYLALFLVALDRTIISTAIPQITDDFHSLGDVGWYGSAYLITSCAFQLLYGRMYTFYSPKWIFLIAIGLFEVGSAVCGAAPSSIAFIIGRAIAGLGSAGVFSGAIVLSRYVVPLHKRPLFQGFFGAVFGISGVGGPLLGGVFTTKVSWRWNFYINLPIGAVTIVIVSLILKAPAPVKANTPFREQLVQLDLLGNLFFLPGIVCLLLALQWGGSTYAWSDGRIIALLVLFAVLIIAFIAIQIWKGENATVPPRIIRKRSIAAGFWYTICIGATLLVVVYFLPLWFQSIKGATAVRSGFMLLPLIMSVVISSILTGAAVTKLGYYTPFMIAGSVIMSVGAGLLTTFHTNTGHAKWIGYQVIFGFGLGMCAQQSSLAAQTVLDKRDAPTGISLAFFAQTLGGAIFVSVGQNIFSSHLVSGLSKVAGLDPAAIVNAGATNLRTVVSTASLGATLTAYNQALIDVYRLAVVTASLSIIGALAMEWKSVKHAKKAQEQAKLAQEGKKAEV